LSRQQATAIPILAMKHQTGQEAEPMHKVITTDPMESMRRCQGKCDRVPDEVCDAVLDTLTFVPGGDRSSDARDARAVALAPRMAAEGWRFCPCFSEGNTQQHARIFGLMHTNLANRLAQKAVLEAAFSSENQSAA
jgi:hypothetical protein